MRNIFAIVLLLFADVKIYSKIFVIIHSIFIIHVYLPIRSATVYKVCLHFMGGLKREHGSVYCNIYGIYNIITHSLTKIIRKIEPHETWINKSLKTEEKNQAHVKCRRQVCISWVV